MEAIEVGRRAKSGVRWSTIEMLIGSVLRLVQVTVLARVLGPSAFGIIAILMIIVDLARLLSEAGLAEAVIQRKTISREQQSTLYWLNLGFGFLVYLIIVAVSPLIERMFEFPRLGELIAVIGLAIVFMSAGTQVQSMIRRNMDFGKMAFAGNFSLFAGVAVMCVSAIFYSQGVWSFVWGTLTEAVVRLIILFGFAVKGDILPRFCFSVRSVKSLLAFGGFRSGGMLANFFAARTDQILIGAFFPAAALGIYNLAYNFSSIPARKIGSVVTRVAFPAFSRLQEDKARLREGYLSMIENISIITAPIIGGLAGIAPVFVPFVFGEEWADGVPLIQIILIYGFLGAINRPVGTLIMGAGHADWSLYWNLVMLILKIGVISLAAWSGSIYVVGWTLVGMVCVTLPASYYFMINKIIGSAFGEMLRRISRPVFATLIMCLLVHLLGYFIQTISPVLQLAVLVPFGCLIYLSFGLLLFKKDLEFLARAACA